MCRFHSLVKLTDHLKENLACQILDARYMYAISKMCNVMCNFLVVDQARSCESDQLWHRL